MSGPNPLLVKTGGGFSLRFGDRWLYSRYQPRLAAEKAALDVPVNPDTLYVLVSPCLCHGLDTLAARLPSSSAVLGIELEAPLLALARDGFSALNLYPLRSKLATSTIPNVILAEAAGLGKFRKVKEVRLSGGKDLHSAEYDGLIVSITTNNRLAWRNRMTLVRLGRLWAKNVIANLANLPWEQVVPVVQELRPVLLCGAGPSLTNALPWIKKHATQLMIMAVDTAAGSLAQAGIVPDQVVCLEAQAHNLPDFTPLAGLEVTLVADISAHPATFRITKGPKNLVSSQWMNSGFLGRLSTAGLPIQPVPPLGSVGVLAARLAVQQGRMIFITGLDFSFMRGITHCKGSPSDLAERRLESRLYKWGRNWDLSHGLGVVPQAGGSLGNTILSMYAACAGVELQDAAVFDIREGVGLPLPAKAISLDQAGELLAALPGSGPGSLQDTTRGEARSALYRSAALVFLEKELQLAQSLSRRLRTGDEGLTADIIHDCNYMYAHFPDPERVEAMEIDALKRLAVETG
ncbi:MAG: 6-hydroxymethylpterin diphosphokinase MptE-like protein, partial [Spirochaetota bacterium]